MLKDDDLVAFLDAFAVCGAPEVTPIDPRNVLLNENGLFPAEVWRLACSLNIMLQLGDVRPEAVKALQVVLGATKDARCEPFSNLHAWSSSLAWALAQPSFSDPSSIAGPLGRDRERIVGAACLRLRKRGFTVDVGAYGPRIAEGSRREIIRQIDAYVGLLGGSRVASQLLRHLRDNKLYHDGLWLFGEVGLNIYDHKRPMPPVGWLFSMSLRKLRYRGNARKPDVAWATLIELTTDFAAAHDCQRYSSFEGVDLHPSEFHRTILESILWRELFTLPQMPANALLAVLEALCESITHEEAESLGLSIRSLMSEVSFLLRLSADDRENMYDVDAISPKIPILKLISGGVRKAINEEYGDPLAANGRTQDSALLLSCPGAKIFILPSSLLSVAICNCIFEFIWKKIGSRAGVLIGRTLEHAVRIACHAKTRVLFCQREYSVNRERFEIDVAARDGDFVVFIETKGKSLTRESRSGSTFKFIEDYTESFLRLMSQLVRHEANTRSGYGPIADAGEFGETPRFVKVAVSPLSYGPVSDKFLSSSIIRSLAGATLKLVSPDNERQRIIDRFNRRTRSIFGSISSIAGSQDHGFALRGILIDTFWLDFGQLIYVINRANSVREAFSPLEHISFSSRDFWTEVAYADRSGLTTGKWRPIT